MQIDIGKVPDGAVLVYEYGVRLDKESQKLAGDQIAMARRLYNDLVAAIRDIVDGLQAFVLSRAGSAANDIQERLQALSVAFDAARARDDRAAMKRIADARRPLWRELGDALKETRRTHRAAIQRDFLSRIGKNSTCETYQIRCRAVAGGLGWASANAVLDAALIAFKKSLAHGRAPRFSCGADKVRDTLTLQFTAAGGVGVDAFLTGRHGELSLLPSNGCGPRCYGEFKFRLGTAGAASYATGTWQYHRLLPTGAHVSAARLVRRRIGKDCRWFVQLVVRLPAPIRIPCGQRQPLVALHFGWSADLAGRRVAGIADRPEPELARILQLPVAVEAGLERAASIQGERDLARDELVSRIRALDLAAIPVPLLEDIKLVRRLPVQHVAQSRLHRLFWLSQNEGVELAGLAAWRNEDRLRWQAAAHLGKRARNARRDFYRNEALRLACSYDAVVIQPLDLSETAEKVDGRTGEPTDMARKARSGRVVAAIYEFESAIRWACAKAGTALLELIGKTARRCSLCGGSVRAAGKNGQVLHCNACGADLDRKMNGAALAWQAVAPDLDGWIAKFWSEQELAMLEKHKALIERKERQAAGRRQAHASHPD